MDLNKIIMSSTTHTDNSGIPEKKHTSKQENETNNDELLLYKRLNISETNAIAQEYICCLSLELMTDPVMAKDGHLYEREFIQRVIEIQGDNFRSPKTNDPMGTELVTAFSARNTIEYLMKSDLIDSELAERYKERKRVLTAKTRAAKGCVRAMNNLGFWFRDGRNGLPKDDQDSRKWFTKANDTRYVNRTKKLAENGDSKAMYCYGDLHAKGLHGVEKNDELANEWFKKSAKLKNYNGMAAYGYYLIGGLGGEKNTVHGTSLLTKAAMTGVDSACFWLGRFYFFGIDEFPKDYNLAKEWLMKAIDGNCIIKTLPTKTFNKVQGWLKEIKDTEL